MTAERKPAVMAAQRATKTDVANETWFVYLLRCADGSLYTGITTDVARRSKQHNAGTASRYTRSRRPTRMVYEEVHAGHSQALQREAAIKSLSRPQKESLIRNQELSTALMSGELSAATCGRGSDRPS